MNKGKEKGQGYYYYYYYFPASCLPHVHVLLRRGVLPCRGRAAGLLSRRCQDT